MNSEDQVFSVDARAKVYQDLAERWRKCNASAYRALTRLRVEQRIRIALEASLRAELKAVQLEGAIKQAEALQSAQPVLRRVFWRLGAVKLTGLISYVELRVLREGHAAALAEAQVLKAFYQQLLGDEGRTILGTAEATARSIEADSVDPPVLLPVAVPAPEPAPVAPQLNGRRRNGTSHAEG